MEKRQSDFVEGREYDDEGEYEYKMFREYNWNVKSKASKGYEENFFFVIRETGIFYNELETRYKSQPESNIGDEHIQPLLGFA